MVIVNTKKIRSLREDEGLTVAELGEAAGVSRTMMTYYEQGKRQPQIEALAFIAKRLGVTMEDLVIDTEA